MGIALRDRSLSAPREGEDALGRAAEERSSQAEQVSRSGHRVMRGGLVSLAVSGAAVTFQLLGHTPGALTPARVLPIAAVSFALFALASAFYQWVGPNHWAYRAADLADEAWRSVAVMWLMVLAGPLAGGFLLASMMRGFVWRPESDQRSRRTWVVQPLAHLSVSAFCLAEHRPTAAMLVVLALCAFLIAYGMTQNAQRRALRVRVERDLLERELLGLEVGSLRGRIAREIHDGAGADLLALFLLLRREATTDPAAAAMAKDARGVLEDLRTVVWSLKGDHGTLGELAKLLDAKCASASGDATYARLALRSDAHQALPTSVALALLRAAAGLVHAAVHEAGASAIQLSLTAGEQLCLRIEADDASPTARIPEEAHHALADAGGTLRAEPLEGREGLAWSLSLPFAPTN